MREAKYVTVERGIRMGNSAGMAEKTLSQRRELELGIGGVKIRLRCAWASDSQRHIFFQLPPNLLVRIEQAHEHQFRIWTMVYQPE